jgi:hypothetical protein
MKITKTQLKQIIKEELSQVLAEQTPVELRQIQRDLTLSPEQAAELGVPDATDRQRQLAVPLTVLTKAAGKVFGDANRERIAHQQKYPGARAGLTSDRLAYRDARAARRDDLDYDYLRGANYPHPSDEEGAEAIRSTPELSQATFPEDVTDFPEIYRTSERD